MVNRGDLRDMPDGAEMQLKVVGLDGEELAAWLELRMGHLGQRFRSCDDREVLM